MQAPAAAVPDRLSPTLNIPPPPPPSHPSGVNLLLYEALGWDDFADVIVKHHDRFMNIVPRTPKGLVYYNEWVRGVVD